MPSGMYVRRTNEKWPDERVDTLRRLWGEGLSASQCARQIGAPATRNSVIGKLRRLGMLGTRQQQRPERPSHKPKPRREYVRLPTFKKEKRMTRPEPIAPLNIPFLDIRLGECRAITDSTRDAQRCCGHPVDERGTYCSAHRAIFYTRSQGKSA